LQEITVELKILAVKKMLDYREFLYPLHTSQLAIHLTPATRHPEASHANCKLSRHGFRVAEGSASLLRRNRVVLTLT